MARIRIGDMLVRAGLIDELQLQSALAVQRQWGGRLGDVLVDQGFLDEMMLWRGLAKQLSLPLVSFATTVPDKGALACAPLDLMNKHDVMVVSLDGAKLTLATSDPGDIAALDEVAFRTGKSVRAVLCPPREIRWAIDRHYRNMREPMPPPQTKTVRKIDADQAGMEIVQRGGDVVPVGQILGGHVSTPTSDLLRASAGASPFSAPSVPPMPVGAASGPAPAVAGGGALAAVEHDLSNVTTLLRHVVESCIRRGVFTREEYLARVEKASRA